MRDPQLTWGQTDGIMAAITWSPSQGMAGAEEKQKVGWDVSKPPQSGAQLRPEVQADRKRSCQRREWSLTSSSAQYSSLNTDALQLAAKKQVLPASYKGVTTKRGQSLKNSRPGADNSAQEIISSSLTHFSFCNQASFTTMSKKRLARCSIHMGTASQAAGRHHADRTAAPLLPISALISKCQEA